MGFHSDFSGFNGELKWKLNTMWGPHTIAKLVNITSRTRLYDVYNYIRIVNGVYRPIMTNL